MTNTDPDKQARRSINENTRGNLGKRQEKFQYIVPYLIHMPYRIEREMFWRKIEL